MDGKSKGRQGDLRNTTSRHQEKATETPTIWRDERREIQRSCERQVRQLRNLRPQVERMSRKESTLQIRARKGKDRKRTWSQSLHPDVPDHADEVLHVQRPWTRAVDPRMPVEESTTTERTLLEVLSRGVLHLYPDSVPLRGRSEQGRSPLPLPLDPRTQRTTTTRELGRRLPVRTREPRDDPLEEREAGETRGKRTSPQIRDHPSPSERGRTGPHQVHPGPKLHAPGVHSTRRRQDEGDHRGEQARRA